MKLDRNVNGDGRGKYGLILNRRLASVPDTELGPIQEAIDRLEAAGIIDWGTTTDTEFFVVRLRDVNAPLALRGYADAAITNGDRELSYEVEELAIKARRHPHRKAPD